MIQKASRQQPTSHAVGDLADMRSAALRLSFWRPQQNFPP